MEGEAYVEGEAPAEPSSDQPPATAEDIDSLPAVGKVFEGEKRSLGAIFAASRVLQPRIERQPNEAANIETIQDGEFAPVMNQLRKAMTQHGSGYEGILVHGQIVALANGQATIRYSHQHEASARMLERNGKREAVQQVLSDLVNEPIGLTIEVEEEAEIEPQPTPQSRAFQPRIDARTKPRSDTRPAAPQAPAAPASPPLTQEQKQKILETDPWVKAAVELFSGEIVKAD